MPPARDSAAITAGARPVLFPNWRDMPITPESQPQIESFPFEPDQPYYTRYSLSVQQQVLPTTVVSVTYTAARGAHLLRHVGVNLAEPQILADGSRFYPAPGRLRNPNFGSIRYKLTDGTSEYDGLTIDLRRRWADGFQFQAAFTLASSIDDGAAAAGNGDFAGDNVVPREFLVKNYGRSPWDIRRTFVASIVYDLPLGAGRQWLGTSDGILNHLVSGWQISAITQLADGSPFSALLGFVPAGFIAGTG